MPSPLLFPGFKQKLHKEEQKHRRLVDAEDQSMIAAKVEKYPHPLEDSKIHLYNPVTGQVAPADVNVMDSFLLERKWSVHTSPLSQNASTVLYLDNVYY